MNSPISITNTGAISATSKTTAFGIYAFTYGSNSAVTINNSGNIRATSSQSGPYSFSYGINAVTIGSNSPITINNSGSVFAEGPAGTPVAAIYTYSPSGTTIINSGDIGASSNLAILGYSGPVDIFNTGTITGFVALDADDRFINQAGGVFEARQTSDFDAYGTGGNDLFRNQAGGTVHTANNANVCRDERLREPGDLPEQGHDLDGRWRRGRRVHDLQHAGRQGPQFQRLGRLHLGSGCLPRRAGLHGG